jgi:hypothetical protein
LSIGRCLHTSDHSKRRADWSVLSPSTLEQFRLLCSAATDWSCTWPALAATGPVSGSWPSKSEPAVRSRFGAAPCRAPSYPHGSRRREGAVRARRPKACARS